MIHSHISNCRTFCHVVLMFPCPAPKTWSFSSWISPRFVVWKNFPSFCFCRIATIVPNRGTLKETSMLLKRWGSGQVPSSRWLSTLKGRNKHREVVDVLGLPMVFASQKKWFHQQERLVERNWLAEYVNATKKGDFTSKNQDNFNSNQVELFKIYMWYMIGFCWLLPKKTGSTVDIFTNELVNINQQTELSGVHVVQVFLAFNFLLSPSNIVKVSHIITYSIYIYIHIP